MWFEAMLGLRININKSDIIPVEPVSKVEDIAIELGCRISSFPTSYLGLPLGASHKAIWVWDMVEKRFWKRLASWKMQYISKGGRLTLLHSTLSSLLIFLLISLLNTLESMC